MISLQQKLLSKIALSTETGCWEWTACKFKNGYGKIRDGKDMRRAHRVSYEVFRGSIPQGQVVCHGCDHRGCINPNHLFLGTQAQNMADMTAKGRRRGLRGSTNSQAKLSETDVLAIRSSNGIKHRDLAAQFGVHRTLISQIRSGKSWRHMSLTLSLSTAHHS